MGIVVACLLTALQSAVAIYVGPAERDGFIDVDQGILDSIKDVESELRAQTGIRLVRTPAEAQLILTITRRTVGDPILYVGSGASGGNVVAANSVPIHGRILEATLTVGTHTKPLLADERSRGTWKAAAKLLAADVVAWLTANRSKLP